MAEPVSHLLGGNDARDDAVAVVRALRDAGHVAYFAGGCVRDELMGLIPKDYDVATDATPDVVRHVFGQKRTQSVGAAFGVILVRQGASTIEVATFRADEGYTDGRRPDAVRFTNAEEDALRRDFTINGLFRDPLAQLADEHDDGVIDYVGGKRDLAAKLVRAIGKPRDRFAEDYLRLLRAVRFTARFGFSMHADTLAAVREFAPRLASISAERIGDELRRMLVPPTRGAAWQLLWDTELIYAAFSALPRGPLDNAHRPFTRHVASIPRDVSFALAVAAMVADLLLAAGAGAVEIFAPEMVARTVAAAKGLLRLSNAEMENLAAAMGIHPLLWAPASPNVAKLKRFASSRHAADARVMLDAVAGADRSLADQVARLRERLNALDNEENAPPPLVTGDDLVAAGVSPGPHFKAALDAAYDAQLEGRVTTREAALEVALTVAQASLQVAPAPRATRRR